MCRQANSTQQKQRTRWCSGLEPELFSEIVLELLREEITLNRSKRNRSKIKRIKK